MPSPFTPGFPPNSVVTLLRVEGVAALAAAVTAYWFLGGNWWLFALLILAPDLSFFGLYAGPKAGAKIYNFAHTYTLPAILGAVGWFGGIGWLTAVALIWIAHIGMDRAVGYGLKYPGFDHQTHLGLIGKARKAQTLADAR
ncbi:MAG: hypothetical protein JWQ89_1788 [Devosia sp.]|uniref:DUF4260 domain-containing protein n=1 Tax=Devosia sp. TaxID=1871048 RepID=UPI0026252858|nr:DUF4260 domain-containing protein [Devosia sp.]MDB5540061.1 hypothetical protein [Devosia sp.]